MQIPYISRISVSKLAVPLVFKMVLKIGILATALVFTSSATLAGGVLGANQKAAANTPKSNTLPVLQKHATSVSNASGGNYTVDWVVQYANTSGQTITNATVKEGPISTIIPGSLQQPAGWAGVTSTGNTIATWTGASLPPFGVMTAPITSTPSSAPLSGATGDGYGPIPYSHSLGLRIYLLNHHLQHSLNVFDCIDGATRTRCPTKAGGTPWPRQLPQGETNLAKVSGTLTAPEPLVDGTKMFYSWNHQAEGYGLGCFDLETELPCGKVSFLASQTNPTSHLSGPWKVGNNLYFAASTGQLFCVDKTSLGKCSGLSAIAIPTSTIKLKATQEDNTSSYGFYFSQSVAGSVVGNRVYLTSLVKGSNGTGTKYTNCYDNFTKSACWGTHSTLAAYPGTADIAHVSDVAAQHIGGTIVGELLNLSNFIYYDALHNPIAICQLNSSALHAPYTFSADYETDGGQHCVKLINGKNATLSEMPNIWISATNVPVSTQKEVHIWPRTYFTEPRLNRVFCWDWSTSSKCNIDTEFISNGFKKWPGTIVGGVDDYAMKQDDQGCIWVYGDSKHLWNFDPQNLDANGKPRPCGGSGKFTQTFQPLTYCSGAKPFHWLSVAVTGAPITNYTKFIIKVIDSSNNTTLLTKDLMPAGPMLVDISSLDAQTLSQPLKIEVEYTPKPNVNDKPILEVRYDGPPMEFCFKSEHKCDQGPITNKVSTEFPDAQSARASFGGQSNSKTKLYTAQANAPTAPSCPSTCGTAGQPLCPLCDCLGNAVPVCGTPGQPPCPKCGQVGQPPCPACGQAGQPLCPDCTATPANGGGTVTPKNASQPRSSATNSSIYK